MFDGIDELVLPTHSIDPLLDLYVDIMGFTVLDDESVHGPDWQQIWHLPLPPDRIVTLRKPNSHGGGIRLVSVPGLPAAAPAVRPDRIGPYALDFFLRDPDAVEARMDVAGWAFRSPAVHYHLPGTDIDVRERMLCQTNSGLLHALVQHRPRGTRCVLGHDESEVVSEVATAVFLTDRFTEATAFARDVLGAEEYFTGRFDGPAVERMLDLAPGEGLETALFRGPRSHNARLEFAEILPGSDEVSGMTPRVIATIAVTDLDALHRALADGAHGPVVGPRTIGGRRHVGLASRYGAMFDFVDRVSEAGT